MSLLFVYVTLVGGMTASIQVTRGVVRGVGKLIEGEPRAALGEVVGGLVAPLHSAFAQMYRLGDDVCQAANALSLDESEPAPSVQSIHRDRQPFPQRDGVPGLNPA
ncbi:MAG: hypothetical protein FJ271_24915 [Planctomycetes bacterium]|nr:hypothetical protein [Planctomycetota bacterium]